MLTQEQKQELMKHAKVTLKKAYAPYSKFYVGAAILTEDDQIFVGANVENASYGGTICAERSAIVSAIGQRGHFKLKAVAVATHNDSPGAPCGLCRQFMSEFGLDALILFQGQNGIEEVPLRNLLPHAFTDFDSA